MLVPVNTYLRTLILMIKKFTPVFIIIFLCINLYEPFILSQTLPVQDPLFKKGKTFYKAAQYDSAIYYFLSAAEQLKAKTDTGGYLRCLNILGDSYRLKDERENAQKTLEQSLKLTMPAYKEERAQAYENLGLVHIDEGEYQQAVELLNRALDIKLILYGKNDPNTATAYLHLGTVYYYLRKLDRAREFYKHYLDIMRQKYGEENELVSTGYQNLGIIYDVKGDYKRALELYQKSLDIRIKVLGKNHLMVADSYNGIAIVNHFRGDHERAIQYFKKALAIRLHVLGENHALVAESYNNLGLAYMGFDQYEQALKTMQKALSIREKIFNKDHPAVEQSQINLGLIFLKKKEYNKALTLFNQVLQERRKTLGKDHPLVASCLFDIAQTKAAQGEKEEAIKFYLKSADIRSRSLGKHHPDIADAYFKIGKIYQEQSDLNAALRFFQRALFVLTPGFRDSSFYANPSPDSVVSQTSLWLVLLAKANTLAQRGAVTDHLQDRKAAHSIYIMLAELIRSMRYHYTSEESKLFLSKETEEIYYNAVANAIALHEITSNKLYLEKAFGFMEDTKANVLYEAIMESQAGQFSGIPDSLLQQEKSLKIDLTFYKTERLQELTSKNVNSEKVSALDNKIFALKQIYNRLDLRLEHDYPDYYQLKYQPITVTVSEIQNRMDKHTEFLEYLVGEKRLFIFCISNSNFFVKSADLSSPLTDMVKQLRQALSNLDFATYLKTAHHLYNKLIKPIADEHQLAQKLIIVPDGILNYLPFEALLTQAVKASASPAFANLPYLIRNHEISYVYSSSLLFMPKKIEKANNVAGFIGFAPVFSDAIDQSTQIASLTDSLFPNVTTELRRSITVNGKSFSALPATEHEIKIIQQTFKKQGINSRIFVHREARERLVKSLDLAKYKYVHFATHTFINDAQPGLSGIVFTAESPNATEDGILRTGEIYNLNLNANLVVLSACESGLGLVSRGEGVLGLTRAFVYAGAQNVMVSLWQVADKSTSELMIEFYKDILNGESYSSSLRNAKLRLIKGGKYSYPLEWSPFILIGK